MFEIKNPTLRSKLTFTTDKTSIRGLVCTIPTLDCIIRGLVCTIRSFPWSLFPILKMFYPNGNKFIIGKIFTL